MRTVRYNYYDYYCIHSEFECISVSDLGFLLTNYIYYSVHQVSHTTQRMFAPEALLFSFYFPFLFVWNKTEEKTSTETFIGIYKTLSVCGIVRKTPHACNHHSIHAYACNWRIRGGISFLIKSILPLCTDPQPARSTHSIQSKKKYQSYHHHQSSRYLYYTIFVCWATSSVFFFLHLPNHVHYFLLLFIGPEKEISSSSSSRTVRQSLMRAGEMNNK